VSSVREPHGRAVTTLKQRSSRARRSRAGNTLQAWSPPALLADLRRACGEDGVVHGRPSAGRTSPTDCCSTP